MVRLMQRPLRLCAQAAVGISSAALRCGGSVIIVDESPSTDADVADALPPADAAPTDARGGMPGDAGKDAREGGV
jgi:hypothetical protein